MHPCRDDVIDHLYFRVPVHNGVVDVPKKLTENFLRNEVVEPVKAMELVSPVRERPAPQSFTLTLIDLGTRGALVQLKDMKRLSNRLIIGEQ